MKGKLYLKRSSKKILFPARIDPIEIFPNGALLESIYRNIE